LTRTFFQKVEELFAFGFHRSWESKWCALTGFIEQQEPVYIAHEVFLIYREISTMPSLAFSESFTRLCTNALTTHQPQERNTNNKLSEYVKYDSRTFSHHFALLNSIIKHLQTRLAPRIYLLILSQQRWENQTSHL
jgi:hypothetical protein